MKDYFPDYETECNCGCGENNFSEKTRLRLFPGFNTIVESIEV